MPTFERNDSKMRDQAHLYAKRSVEDWEQHYQDDDCPLFTSNYVVDDTGDVRGLIVPIDDDQQFEIDTWRNCIIWYENDEYHGIPIKRDVASYLFKRNNT